MPYHKLLYRVAYRMTGNAQDAEDLLQDLYLKLWQKRDELPEEAQNQAYFVTMIHNLFYDRHRLKELDTLAEMNENIEPPNPISLEQQIELKDEAIRMTQLIERLPDKERRIVQMHVIEERSYDEIQNDTGLSQGNIRLIVMRTKNKLKEQFLKYTQNGRNKL